MQNGVSSGQLTAEHVLAGGLIEHLREHSDGPPQWHDYITAGARVYYYDGHIPCNLFIVDGTVLLLNDRANAGEVIESENETVRSWAHELIATYREVAEPIEADTFLQPSCRQLTTTVLSQCERLAVARRSLVQTAGSAVCCSRNAPSKTSGPWRI
jgi:hypothetical protein